MLINKKNKIKKSAKHSTKLLHNSSLTALWTLGGRLQIKYVLVVMVSFVASSTQKGTKIHT